MKAHCDLWALRKTMSKLGALCGCKKNFWLVTQTRKVFIGFTEDRPPNCISKEDVWMYEGRFLYFLDVHMKRWFMFCSNLC